MIPYNHKCRSSPAQTVSSNKIHPNPSSSIHLLLNAALDRGRLD